MTLFSIMCVALFADIPNSSQAVIRIFDCLSIDQKEITVLFTHLYSSGGCQRRLEARRDAHHVGRPTEQGSTVNL